MKPASQKKLNDSVTKMAALFSLAMRSGVPKMALKERIRIYALLQVNELIADYPSIKQLVEETENYVLKNREALLRALGETDCDAVTERQIIEMSAGVSIATQLLLRAANVATPSVPVQGGG